jgi:hypothetical protein
MQISQSISNAAKLIKFRNFFNQLVYVSSRVAVLLIDLEIVLRFDAFFWDSDTTHWRVRPDGEPGDGGQLVIELRQQLHHALQAVEFKGPVSRTISHLIS